MGCELTRENKPNDLIKANENVLKLRSKSVAEITEAFFNLNRIEDGVNYIEKTRLLKGINVQLKIEYTNEDYRLIVSRFLEAFFIKTIEDIYSNRKLEHYDYFKLKTYLYLLCTGTTEDKARAIFRTYDTEGKEVLTREELETLFSDLFGSVKRVGEILSELEWIKLEQQQEAIKGKIDGAKKDVLNFLLKDGKLDKISETEFVARSAEYVKATLRDIFNAEGARRVVMPFVFQSMKDRAAESQK